MDVAAVIIRLALAGVFAVSGIAKLFNPQGTRVAAEAFGVPRGMRGPVSYALPVAELAIAGSLAPATSARIGALAATGLLVVFLLVVTVALARGRRPECNCFGAIRSSRVGPATLMRNGILIALGAFTAFAAGADAGGTILGIDDTAGVLVRSSATLVVLVVAFAVVRLRSARASSDSETGELASTSGLGIASPAPDFALPDIEGRVVSLNDLLGRGKQLLIVFVSMGCRSCAALAPQIAQWQRDLSDRLTIAVVSAGSIESVRTGADRYDFGELLIDEARVVANSYRNPAAPAAVLVDTRGAIASAPAIGVDGITDLLLRVFGLDEIVASLGDEVERPPAIASAAGREELKEIADSVDPADIDGSYVARGRGDVGAAERNGEHVLVDRADGAVHLLNATAAVVWECLDGSGTIAEIAADLAQAFGRDPTDVFESVLDVVRSFARAGLLDSQRSSPSSVPASG